MVYKLFSSFSLTLAGLICMGQSSANYDSNYFSNEMIKYDVVLLNNKISNKKESRKGVFVSINMDKKLERELLHETNDFWLSKLKDNRSDWATNLVLYYLYNRDAATLLYINNDRKKWLKLKNYEIYYWTKWFNNREVK